MSASQPPQPEPASRVRPSRDFRTEPWLPKLIVLVIALGAIGGGSGLLIAAFSGAEYIVKSPAPLWIGYAAGLMFLLPGLGAFGFFLYGIGVPLRSGAGFLGLLLALSGAGLLAAIFHQGAFFAAPESWGGTRFGPLGPRDFARVGVVWMDLLVLQFVVLLVWLARLPAGHLPARIKAWQRWRIPAFFAAPAAVAFALHFAGAYDRIEREFGPAKHEPAAARTAAPATPAGPKPPPAAKPLEYFLGTWINPQPGRHESHKVEIRAEGGSVHIRVTRTCVPKECVLGAGRAEVIRTPDKEQVIDLRAEFKNASGETSTIALTPEGAARLRSRESWRTGARIYHGDVRLRRKDQ